MIDGSHESFEDNIAVSKAVADACHPGKVPVEAELGKVGGKEDDLDGGDDNPYTDYSISEDAVYGSLLTRDYAFLLCDNGVLHIWGCEGRDGVRHSSGYFRLRTACILLCERRPCGNRRKQTCIYSDTSSQ